MIPCETCGYPLDETEAGVLGWVSMDETFPDDECDIRLTDGSILTNVIPQFDEDFYYRGSFGEEFISNTVVTHWRGK